jgi:hypothetical protein
MQALLVGQLHSVSIVVSIIAFDLEGCAQELPERIRRWLRLTASEDLLTLTVKLNRALLSSTCETVGPKAPSWQKQ